MDWLRGTYKYVMFDRLFVKLHLTTATSRAG